MADMTAEATLNQLVTTDGFAPTAWRSAEPFVTGVLTLEDEVGASRHTACARHGSAEDRVAHEAMGFRQGRRVATDQLAGLAGTR